MSPLSKDLSGIILPYDHFGNHLGPNGTTIDKELEKKNFEKAGNCLAEVWNQSEIDGYPIQAKYIPPGQQQFGSVPEKSEAWKSIHVRQSQYLIQVVKCDDVECCGIQRTNLKAYLHDGFLPAPVKYTKDATGMVPASRDATEAGHFIGLSKRICLKMLDPDYLYKNESRFPLPYDYYCPSLTDKKLEERVCKECGLYFASKKSQTAHGKVHRAKEQEEITYFFYQVGSETEIGNVENNTLEDRGDDEDRMHIIEDMSSWYTPDFEEI